MATRRQVLARIFGGGAFLAAAGGLAWFRLGYDLLPGEIPVALDTKELVVVRSLVQALLPGGDGLPSGVEIGIPQRIDEEVWAAPEAVAKDLKAGLLLLEHGPLALGFLGRFSSLSVDKRQALPPHPTRAAARAWAPTRPRPWSASTTGCTAPTTCTWPTAACSRPGRASIRA